MTDNKHAEAVEVVARALAQRFIDREKARVTGSFYDHVSQLPRSYMADFRDDARAALAALNTRPDVEAFREECLRIADRYDGDGERSDYAAGMESASRQIYDAIRSIPVPISGEKA